MWIILLMIVQRTEASFAQVKCGLQFQETGSTSNTHSSSTIEKGDRIVNGQETLPDEFPWIVSIQVKSSDGKWSHQCGGSVIAPDIILTAAHCSRALSSDTTNRVVLGCHDLSDTQDCQIIEFGSEDLIEHEDYGRLRGKNHDIAIIKLNNTNVRYTNEVNHAVGPACLPPLPDFAYQGMATASGYGKLEAGGIGGEYLSTKLQAVDLNILSASDCEHTVNEAFNRDLQIRKTSQLVSFVRETQVCAGFRGGRKDSCEGDSGGPLMISRQGQIFVMGIVSFGPWETCGNENLPGVYTKVSHYVNWIKKQVKLYSKHHTLVKGNDTFVNSSPNLFTSPATIEERFTMTLDPLLTFKRSL